MKVSYPERVVAVIFFSALPLLATFSTTFAASQYTSKQLEAYGQYVGRTYWIVEHESSAPAFLSAPSAAAPSFQPEVKDSFEIKEIVGGTAQIPAHYYRAVFDSGKEGFLPLGAFLEHFNASFATVDPDRNAKAKLARETEAETKRQAWIRAQRWPEHVKEAALKKQPVLGMSTHEAKAALGKPKRMVLMKSAAILLGAQEQWTYENGFVLTFTNGLITRIQTLEAKGE
ncbi:MAG: hypothetical protein ACREQP_00765 [Candidatus Binatia bacterium]